MYWRSIMQINGELTQVICQPRNDKTGDDNGNYDIMMMIWYTGAERHCLQVLLCDDRSNGKPGQVSPSSPSFPILILITSINRWMTCTAKAVNAFGFAAAHEYIKVD